MVDGDKIYSGSYKEFGLDSKRRKMNYVSISKGNKVLMIMIMKKFGKFLNLTAKIYFQSFNIIFFIYDGKFIRKIKLPFLTYGFIVDNQLLIASVENGVFRMNNSNLQR
jgi:hypothetical protein